MLLDAAKVKAVKAQDWKGTMINPMNTITELTWWISKIKNNKPAMI